MVKEFEQPWKQVVDPAQVFLLTMARAGMEVTSATTLRMLSGETLKLDKLAPGMVKVLAVAEARKAADMLAMVKEQKDGSCWIGPVFWDGLKKLLGKCNARAGSRRRGHV